MICCIFDLANKESGALVVKLGLRDYFMVSISCWN